MLADFLLVQIFSTFYEKKVELARKFQQVQPQGTSLFLSAAQQHFRQSPSPQRNLHEHCTHKKACPHSKRGSLFDWVRAKQTLHGGGALLREGTHCLGEVGGGRVLAVCVQRHWHSSRLWLVLFGVDFVTAYLYLLLLSDHNDNFINSFRLHL